MWITKSRSGPADKNGASTTLNGRLRDGPVPFARKFQRDNRSVTR